MSYYFTGKDGVAYPIDGKVLYEVVTKLNRMGIETIASCHGHLIYTPDRVELNDLKVGYLYMKGCDKAITILPMIIFDGKFSNSIRCDLLYSDYYDGNMIKISCPADYPSKSHVMKFRKFLKYLNKRL